MALVDEYTKCAICGQLLDINKKFFATTMRGLAPPLSLLDDTAAHEECVDRWEHKVAFVTAYNERYKAKPALDIDENGHVSWVLKDCPLLDWWMWPLVPFLLPIALLRNARDNLSCRRYATLTDCGDKTGR